MATLLSILLTIGAAILTHCSVRRAQGKTRLTFFMLALLALGVAFSLGADMGGFWVGVYTLLSIFFLVCICTPWIELAWERSRAG